MSKYITLVEGDFVCNIPKGMTNGEVIEALFPNCIDYKGAIEVKTTLDYGKLFRRSWWDSPYKKESEE